MQNYHIYNTELHLVRPDNRFNGAICCLYFGDTDDFQELIASLSPEELAYYNTLRFERRIRSYLLGRFVAKNAVSKLINEPMLSNIQIRSGIFTQPLVVSNCGNIQVSISHCDHFGAAIAYPEAHPMGIDLEEINPDNTEVLERQTTHVEKELLYEAASSHSYETVLTLSWTAKEALSKTLKTGLMTPFELFELSELAVYDNFFIGFFKNFAQYKTISFLIGPYMCSIVHPLKTNILFDMERLRKYFLLKESIDGI